MQKITNELWCVTREDGCVEQAASAKPYLVRSLSFSATALDFKEIIGHTRLRRVFCLKNVISK
ncbi:hypothetical protein IKA15_00700 [bacterium]|nr:hypothetical protein [bacterium]